MPVPPAGTATTAGNAAIAASDRTGRLPAATDCDAQIGARRDRIKAAAVATTAPAALGATTAAATSPYNYIRTIQYSGTTTTAATAAVGRRAATTTAARTNGFNP